MHRAAQDLFHADLTYEDPGASGTITMDRYGGLVELVSTGTQTRTLTNPSHLGTLCVLRMKTDGGDITLTAANGLNVTGNNTAVFADVGDQLVLLSVSHTSGYRWEILVNTGSVALSTV